MSEYTIYYCDVCNRDMERYDVTSGMKAVSESLYHWVEFESGGEPIGSFRVTGKHHVCAYCLEDPDLEVPEDWSIPSWNDLDRRLLERGRTIAARVAWAEGHLTREVNGGYRTGVRRRPCHFHGAWKPCGPRLADDRFHSDDPPPPF